MQENPTPHNIRACPDCDLLQKLPQLATGQAAHCPRCNRSLLKPRADSLNRSLAFALTGIILFILANWFPLLSLKALGINQESTLFSASVTLFNEDRPLLAIVVFLTTILFPLLSLTGMVVVLLSVKLDRVSRRYTAPLFRFLMSTDAWGMLEVFMLAILVAVVKLGDLAEIVMGPSMYAFASLVIIMTLMSLSLDPEDVWKRLRNCTI